MLNSITSLPSVQRRAGVALESGKSNAMECKAHAMRDSNRQTEMSATLVNVRTGKLENGPRYDYKHLAFRLSLFWFLFVCLLYFFFSFIDKS